MLRKLRFLARLSLAEWLLLPQLVAFSLLARAGLRCVPLRRLVSILSGCAESGLSPFVPLLHRRYDWAQLVTLADLATRVTHGQGRCLVRSLLVFWLLKARGKPAELVIGVCKNASALDSHAWIESQGKVMTESPAGIDRFATLLRL